MNQPQEHTSLELIRIYQRLHTKKKEGKFSYTSAMGLAAVSEQLRARGFVLTEDESTWMMKV